MTRIHLVRHGRHVLQDSILAGRTVDAVLSSVGRDEATRAALALRNAGIDRIYCSPRRRAVETAGVLAQSLDAVVEEDPAFDEADFGEWSGLAFRALAGDPEWQAWNSARSQARCPGGDSMEDMLRRFRCGLSRVAPRGRDGAIAIVSHAEPIRAILLHVAGRPFDDYASLDVPTGAVFTLDWDAAMSVGAVKGDQPAIDRRAAATDAAPCAGGRPAIATDERDGGMPPAAIEERVAQLRPWFHNLDLCGVATAPDHFLGDYPRVKFARFADAIPCDLTGKSVLDIGCNAGFYAQEMKRRGAARVVAVDSDPRYLEQARFAAQVNRAEIEFRQMDVYDVPSLGERFDLVVFMGVLYHLRHPLLALDLIAEHCVGDLMLFQSMQRGPAQAWRPDADYAFEEEAVFDRPDFPRLHFIEKNYSGDPTNWWIPNASCVEAMLRASGFEIIERPESEVYLCRRRMAEGAECMHGAPT